ncbi:hypothetical protein UFOVP785_72 [uncultured Caudovirales phage]|uniref:Uncharacterized protein n=1 Tax=uncultured Caudovirales phage TaxID=2100421 RepID=A0A6J5P527_9CAUD|nr:hypothetical protein UFOVP785_72 [uncultured Caudovirales phage]
MDTELRVRVQVEDGSRYFARVTGKVCERIADRYSKSGIRYRYPYPWTDYSTIRDLMLSGF